MNRRNGFVANQDVQEGLKTNDIKRLKTQTVCSKFVDQSQYIEISNIPYRQQQDFAKNWDP
jgi:hypothetical protein